MPASTNAVVARVDGVPKASLWVEVGGRIGYEIELGGAFSVRLNLDGSLILTRYALRIGGAQVFEHPPLSGGLGAALVAAFR